MIARWSSGYEVVEPSASTPTVWGHMVVGFELRQSGGRGSGIVWPCRVHIQTYSMLVVV